VSWFGLPLHFTWYSFLLIRMKLRLNAAMLV